MISVTETAQEYWAQLLSNQKPGTQIRLFIINPGTAHAECGVSYCPPDAVEVSDIEWRLEKISVYVDELSAPYLQDAEIDFVNDKFGSQLTCKIHHTKRCQVMSSKEAPLIERVDYMLQSQINPQLAGHGGHVKLIEITEDQLAIIQFSGGCNGCSMVGYTLKEGIEKELLKTFPELKGVRDLTAHQRSEYSYY